MWRMTFVSATAGPAVTLGGQKPMQRPEPQGEVRPHSTEQQLFGTDFLSGTMNSPLCFRTPLSIHCATPYAV